MTKSKTLAHAGDDFKIYFRLTRKKIVTVVLDTEYDVHYQPLDAAREQSHSYSTRIAEIEHPGETNERACPQETTTVSCGALIPSGDFWRPTAAYTCNAKRFP